MITQNTERVSAGTDIMNIDELNKQTDKERETGPGWCCMTTAGTMLNLLLVLNIDK